MRFKVTFYCNILLCFCICVSYGAPPKEVDADKSYQKYTEEEDQLIVDQLMRLVNERKCNNVWKKITENHNDKWKAKTHGFNKERSVSSIRNRFWGVLIHNRPYAQVKVPETLKEQVKKANLNTIPEDADGSKSKVRNRQINSQVTNVDEDPGGADMILDHPDAHVYKKGGFSVRYTEQEDNFIVEELSRLLDQHVHVPSKNIWNQIAENYHRKWIEGTPGFLADRSARSLHSRFEFFLMLNIQPNRVIVSKDLIRKYFELRSGKPVDPTSDRSAPKIETATRYTPEEDKFLIDELLKSSRTNIFSTSTLESLLAEHDKKREAKIRGFEKVRSVRSLSGHLGIMKNNNQLPVKIMEKINIRQRALSTVSGASSEMPSHTYQSQHTDKETDEMVQELLNNTDYELKW